MMTAVCLNPAIDRTASVAALTPGGLNRVIASRSDAGGKGVNVAVTLARLGEEAACLAFLPRENSRLLEEKLRSEGVAGAGVPLAGAIRTNLKVLDESRGEITEINESGAPVNRAQLDDMASWNIIPYAVTGENASDTTYSMPGTRLSVMYPDADSVARAAELIAKMKEGGNLSAAGLLPADSASDDAEQGKAA